MSNAQTFRESIRVFVDRNLSPQAQSQRLAAYAKGWLGEAVRDGRFSPSHRRWVDGREGAIEEQVRPNGVILYRADQLASAVPFGLAFLQRRAPSDTGAYRRGFYVGVNGRFVPASQFRPELVPAGAEIVIGNVQPYSRKLDVQRAGGRRIKVSMPPDLFADAARAINREFGTVLVARRVYTMNFPGQYRLRRGRKAGRPVESPAVVITPRVH